MLAAGVDALGVGATGACWIKAAALRAATTDVAREAVVEEEPAKVVDAGADRAGIRWVRPALCILHTWPGDNPLFGGGRRVPPAQPDQERSREAHHETPASGTSTQLTSQAINVMLEHGREPFPIRHRHGIEMEVGPIGSHDPR